MNSVSPQESCNESGEPSDGASSDESQAIVAAPVGSELSPPTPPVSGYSKPRLQRLLLSAVTAYGMPDVSGGTIPGPSPGGAPQHF